MRPWRSTMRPTVASMASASRRSIVSTWQVPPTSAISAAVCSRTSVRRAAMTTVAPSEASSWAVQRPRPDPPPGHEHDLAREQVRTEHALIPLRHGTSSSGAQAWRRPRRGAARDLRRRVRRACGRPARGTRGADRARLGRGGRAREQELHAGQGRQPGLRHVVLGLPALALAQLLALALPHGVLRVLANGARPVEREEVGSPVRVGIRERVGEAALELDGGGSAAASSGPGRSRGGRAAGRRRCPPAGRRSRRRSRRHRKSISGPIVPRGLVARPDTISTMSS